MISHIHKCFFICVPKTGSTSVQHALKRSGFKENGKYKKHLTFKEYKKLELRTKNYFSFAFVRNPFDRMVSQYHFAGRAWYTKVYNIKHPLSFHNYIKYIVGADKTCWRGRYESKRNTTPPDSKGIPDLWAAHQISAGDKDWSMFQYIEGGVDFIGRFENLQEDFNRVCESIGIEPIVLPRTNH